MKIYLKCRLRAGRRSQDMFRFNFQKPEENQGQDNSSNIKSKDPDLPAKEIFLTNDHFKEVKSLHNSDIDVLKSGTTNIRYLSQKYIEKQSLKEINSDIFTKAYQLHSDLIPGEYEGGLKIWEGAADLLDHLSTINFSASNLKVLELGCGAGFPGIFMLNKGAKVDFQDYNAEVLNYFTLPNVLLNSCEEEWECLQSRCRFIAGDWSSVETSLLSDLKDDDQRYDLILTAETIYNPDNHSKLNNLLKNVLKSTGSILLAAKTYYFGVGGGIHQFKELLLADQVFQINTCKTIGEGVERVIMQLSRISN